MNSNPNKTHVDYIEGLIMQIGEQLSQIRPETPEEQEARDEAFEYLNNFQINQIEELRIACSEE